MRNYLNNINSDGAELEDWTSGPYLENLEAVDSIPDPPILPSHRKRNECFDFEDWTFDPYLADIINPNPRPVKKAA